ncbi:BTB and MATH domain-containing protein 38-like [Gigantopelta aegis]|uniref:BTB and MATH domain-containing protein 38-like n=1 Tax=Gigantopelta aegis TaxID=1735272 RepID=UPI001B888F71|nr:BTB and MATH domain-containing protein 38-like [Gigantopelta aegis]
MASPTGTVTCETALVFFKPNEDSDVILVVEDRELHLSKAILSCASPVFRKMFTGDFREKAESKILLPGKSCEDFVAFIQCLYPNALNDVTYDNIEKILPLAQAYMVNSLKKKCDNFLFGKLSKFDKSSHDDNTACVYILMLADKFNLVEALKKAIELAIPRPYVQLKEESIFTELSDKTKVEILSKRNDFVENLGLKFSEALMQLVQATPKEFVRCQHRFELKKPPKYCPQAECPHSLAHVTFRQNAEKLMQFKNDLRCFASAFVKEPNK